MNGIPVNGLDVVESVYKFNCLGQSRPPGKHYDAERVGFHTRMQCEELAESIKAIASGCVVQMDRDHMLTFAAIVDDWGKQFKSGKHYGAVLRANREELLDGGIDVLVVTLGSLMYQTPLFVEAIGAVLKANAKKGVDGVFTRDENGKIMKPPGWKKPNLLPYVDQPSD